MVVLKKTDFNSFYFVEGVAGLERTDFNSFYFGSFEKTGMAVLKQLILTVSTLGRCGSLEKTDFN